VSYLAYDSQNIALSDSGSVSFVMDLTDDGIGAAVMQGTVHPVTGIDRGNQAFLRFPSGATIPLLDDWRSAQLDDFSYIVPSLSGASLSVAAYEGSIYTPPFALAYQDGLTSSSSPELTIPETASLRQPINDATGVTTDTQFAFDAAPGVGGHLVYIQESGVMEGIFIVTAETTFTLPEIVQGDFSLYPESWFYWAVEAHGSFATVDAMAGPEGFLDPFSLKREFPTGDRQGGGEFTISEERWFQTAP
jgi:hypothetical protein